MTGVPARSVVRLVVVVFLATNLVGCSRHSSGPSGELVGTRLKDFGVELDRASVPAGQVVFELRNAGPSTHELNVDRLTEAPDDSVESGCCLPPKSAAEPPGVLPSLLSAVGVELRSDGLSVTEDSPAFDRAGSAEDIPLGSRMKLRLKLTKGAYLLYCNLEGHFLGGMEVMFYVT